MPKRNIELHNQPGPRTRLGWRIITADGGQGGNRDPSLPVAAGSPPDGKFYCVIRCHMNAIHKQCKIIYRCSLGGIIYLFYE